MAVFNPTLQADVRFDQPVQQPDVFAAVGGILQGLGVIGQQQQQDNPTDNEQFDRILRQYQAVTGNTAPISQWTPSDFRSFERTAGSRFAARAVELSETMGGTGFVEDRARTDAVSEYVVSPEGQTRAGIASTLYPDDPAQQQNYVIQSYAEHNQRIVAHERLQRDSEDAGYRGNISEEAWAVERNNLYQLSTSAANTLAQIYPQIAAGQSYQLSQVAPEVATMLGYDPTINSSTFGVVAQQVRSGIFSQYTNQLRSLYPGREIRAPSQDFINEVFSPYDNVIEQITSGVNPTEILRRATDSDMLRVRNQLNDMGMPNLLPTMEIAGNLDPNLQRILLSGSFERVGPAFRTILEGGEVGSPESVSNLSSDDREAFETVFTTELGAVAGTAITDMGRAERFVNRLESFIQVQTRSGDRLSPEHYRTIVSPNVVASIDAAGEDGRAMLASLIQSDIGLEVSDLHSIVNRVEGGLVYENGRLTYVPSVLMGDTGDTLGPRRLPSEGQDILDRINGKLEVVSASGDAVTPGFINSLIDGIGIEPRQQSGPGATTPTQQPLPNTTQSNQSLFEGIIDSLSGSESGGNFGASNDIPGSGGNGHFGRLQFSRGRLDEARSAGIIPQDMTPEQFLRNPSAQRRVEYWHINDIIQRINSSSLTQYLGQEIQGVPITMEGMVAAAHLGGFAGMQRFIESGGEYNPSDAYGTSLLDYLRRHGEGGTTAAPDDSTPNAPIDPANVDIIRRMFEGGENFGGEGSVVIENGRTGSGSATTVEQAPSGTPVTPEQQGASTGRSGASTGQQAPIDPRIQSLIDTLTQQGHEEEIRAYLESLTNG